MEFERFLEEAQREAQQRGSALAHPSEGLLWAYVGRQLSEPSCWRVGAHLGGCLQCLEKTEALRQQAAKLDELIQARLPMPPPVPSWSQKVLTRPELDALWQPRRLVVHAVAYAVGSLALLGLNALLNEFFPPPANPLGSPAPPSWWASPAVLGWGVVLGVHAVLTLWFWRKRRRR
jgi:hypothetical protein